MLCIVAVFFSGCASTLKKAERYEFNSEFKKNLKASFGSAYMEFAKSEDGKEVFATQAAKYAQTRFKFILWAIVTLGSAIAAVASGLGWLRAHVQLKKNGNGAH